MGYNDQEAGRTTVAPTEHSHGHMHDHDHAAHSRCGGGDQALGATVAIDPVCGMKVDSATAKHRLSYRDQDYFFCSGRCRERFEADPEKFLAPRAPEPAARAGAIYTCP